jgi:hypothetical protein
VAAGVTLVITEMLEEETEVEIGHTHQHHVEAAEVAAGAGALHPGAAGVHAAQGQLLQHTTTATTTITTAVIMILSLLLRQQALTQRTSVAIAYHYSCCSCYFYYYAECGYTYIIYALCSTRVGGCSYKQVLLIAAYATSEVLLLSGTALIGISVAISL